MSIGSIGIQSITGSSGTPQQASSEASEPKIDTSTDPQAVAADASARQAPPPPPGQGKFVDLSV